MQGLPFLPKKMKFAEFFFRQEGEAVKRLYRFCESYEAVRFESVFFIQRLRALVGV